MWAYPDLLKDEQWTSTSSKKKSKGKTCTFNAITAIPENEIASVTEGR